MTLRLLFLDGGNHGLPRLVDDGSEAISASCHSEPGFIEEGHERLVILGRGCQLLIEKALLKLKLPIKKFSLVAVIKERRYHSTNKGSDNTTNDTRI